MGKVIIGATMSLDGFVGEQNGDLGPLYPDFDALHKTEMLAEEIRTTGAVVMGRRAFDLANGDLTGYEYQTPIFVVTHAAPERQVKGENERLTVTYVTSGVEEAIARAKAAAGARNVMVVGGIHVAQQCLRAGLVDEIHMGVVPVFLGIGLRFFDPADVEGLTLEKARVFESPTRTDLWFRIVR